MTIKVPVQIINLQGMHTYIDISVNGNQQGKLLIDTGASQTVFSSNNTDVSGFLQPITQEEFLKCYPIKDRMKLPGQLNTQLGFDEDQMIALTANSPVSLQFGLIKQLQIGELIINNFPVATIDLSQITNMYSEYYNIHNIWGLLGCDLLYLHRAKLNFSNMTLELVSKPRNLNYIPRFSEYMLQ